MLPWPRHRRLRLEPIFWVPPLLHRGWLGARISLATSRLIAKLKTSWANRGAYPELGT